MRNHNPINGIKGYQENQSTIVLQQQLDRAVEEERYEDAAFLKKLIDSNIYRKPSIIQKVLK